MKLLSLVNIIIIMAGAMIPKGSKLTTEQREQLAEHSKKYSKRHVATMRYWMLHNKSFEDAHELANKKHKK